MKFELFRTFAFERTPLSLAALVMLGLAFGGCESRLPRMLADGGFPADAGNGSEGGGEDAGVDGGASDGGADGGHSPDGGRLTPIKYIVVIIKENHTFDNYFAGFPGADTSATATLSTGATLRRPLMGAGGMSRDLCHSHACAATAFNSGAMDGFNLVPKASLGNPPDNLTFVRYQEFQLPNYWQYARNFAIADHFFATTLGPSFPGHFATVAGFNLALDNPSCSCGGVCTTPVFDPVTCAITNARPCWDAPSIVQELPAGSTWAEYGWDVLRSIKSVNNMPGVSSHFREGNQLLSDVQGNMPNLIFAHVEGALSEHPAEKVCPGENNTVSLINAIMGGPHWKETAILLLWDDWGGFYDSVAPPAVKCGNGDYMTPGFRVPLLVISPYARAGSVLKTPTDQTSIVKLVEDLWNLPRMQPQDARIHDISAGSLLGAFDFTQPPLAPLLLAPRNCLGQP